MKKVTSNNYHLWIIIHQIHDIISKWEDAVLIESSITSQQFLLLWIMKYLESISEKPIILTDLIPLMYRNVNSISAMIYRMEKSNLIERKRDLPDKRASRLVITEKGENICKSAIKLQRKMINDLFNDISEGDQITLLSILRSMKKKVNKILNLTELDTDPEIDDPQKTAFFLKVLNK